MRFVLVPLFLAGSIGVSTPSQADGGPRWGSFGIGVGTGGLGVDYSYPLHDYLDLRAGYDFGSYKRDREENDIKYEAELKFSAARLLVDIKPFRGGFRISAGLYTNTPELMLDASGQDDYDIGDRTYSGDLDIDGRVDLGGAAPYLGVGWGGTASTTGFGMSFDMGVIFAKAPDVGLDVVGRACDATENESCDPNGVEGFDVDDLDDPRAQQFQAEKDQEIGDLEAEAEAYDLWPVIRLGLHYRF